MKKGLSIKVSVILFKEDDTFIAYCPSLDLCGYGYSEKEAKESFSIVIGEYFKYTIDKNTLNADLVALGWSITKETQPIKEPPISKILSSNKDFAEIFNSHDFKKKAMSIPVPLA
jgi:predicted RNase H-like HicB family nuclease